jgi:UBX domain
MNHHSLQLNLHVYSSDFQVLVTDVDGKKTVRKFNKKDKVRALFQYIKSEFAEMAETPFDVH